MAKKTLGKLLPSKQSKLLSKKARKLTKRKLEKELKNIPKSSLSVKDLASLRVVSIIRLNKGESLFTWKRYNFNNDPVDDQDPSTCYTI